MRVYTVKGRLKVPKVNGGRCKSRREGISRRTTVVLSPGKKKKPPIFRLKYGWCSAKGKRCIKERGSLNRKVALMNTNIWALRCRRKKVKNQKNKIRKGKPGREFEKKRRRKQEGGATPSFYVLTISEARVV